MDRGQAIHTHEITFTKINLEELIQNPSTSTIHGTIMSGATMYFLLTWNHHNILDSRLEMDSHIWWLR